MENTESNHEMQKNRSMTEEETVNFLQEKGVSPLQNWQPRQPLLYVLEERIRQDKGPFKDLPRDKRPNVVRINNAVKIDFDHPLIDDADPSRVLYALENPGGQLDYYAIDARTKQIELIKTTIGRIKDSTTTPYHVKKETLFMPNDELFPLAEPTILTKF